MKLVIAIVSNKDLANVLSNTSREGFFSTKISTSGQFLESGQTTILFGTEDDKVEKLFEIIEKSVTKRIVRKTGVESTIEGSLLKKPVDVEEFGAVAFVINVDEFRKL
ncbi:MAG: cyclic-di-AMP receptor [Acetobacter sp.]|nr:cyclic-di-AMP receptor [Bacteroides sp.]MCM1341004.1 cyclic-di-AMP receptor [Acetobacter sp.]MCM1432440.1 cyclic-di-AMP receptor [Clostridiales bacterium]